MKQRFIYILNILFFLVLFFRSQVVSAFDGTVYIEETAARLSDIMTANKQFVAEGKAAEGTYLFNKFKETYEVDLIEAQDATDVNAKLSTFNGKILTVLHAAYPVGPLGNKEALTAVEKYSSAIFSKLAVSGTELGLINIWPIISSDGKSMSYQVNILQTASLSADASAYLSGTKTSLNNTTLSFKNIVNTLLEKNEAGGLVFTFNPEDVLPTEPVYTAAASSANTYFTQSCQYIQFTVPISGEQYSGIYLTSFLYNGKRYSYSYKPVIEKTGNTKTLSGIQRPATTAFLPFAEMGRLAKAGQASGFKVEFFPNDEFVVTLDANSTWYFNSFTVKACAEVSSFKTEYGSIDVTAATCQTYIDNCNKNTTDKNTTTAGSSNLINYAKDAAGLSMLSGDEYGSLLGSVNGLNTEFKMNVKTYILSKQDPDYAKHLKEATDDKTPNKIIIEIDGTKESHTIRLQHTFEIPDWLRPSSSLTGGGDCVVDYVNEALDKLHENAVYKISTLPHQILAEYSVAFYRGIFGALYCSTSEEAVAGKSATIKFMAGATHELIATIDLAEMVAGLAQMAKGIVVAVIESEKSYLLDIRQTYLDITNGVAIPKEELVKRLMPPQARLAVTGAITVMNICTHFTKFYFTECEGVKEFGSDMCAYRYGQVTVMIIPVVLTAGEWLYVKAAALSARLKAVATLGKTEQVLTVLKDAETTGAVVTEELGTITVKEGENITTIEKVDDVVVIEKNGEEVVETVTDVAEKVGKYDWNLVKRYFQYIQEVTGRPIGQAQIDRLKDALRAKEYTKLSPADYAAHTKQFTKAKKNELIARWELETGQTWPTYTEDVYSKNGTLLRKVGDKYDAHHIIEQNYGGEHEWWNMHPAKFPEEHQGGIHGADSPARELFR